MSLHSIVLPLVLVSALTVVIRASDLHHEAVKKDSDLDKRTPFFFPLRPYSSRPQVEDVDDEEENEFDRKRRTPFFYANPKLWKVARNIEMDEEENDLESGEDGFERRRRIPYYYPHHGFDQSRQILNDDDFEELEDKRSLRKRGIPYYFPRLNYAFLPRMDEGNRKRFGMWKRGAKRSLADALEHDDVTDFGYDKRQNLVELDDENDDKRKKKRTLIIKKSG